MSPTPSNPKPTEGNQAMSTSKAGILTINTAQIAQTSNKLDRDARYSIIERLNEVLAGLLDTGLPARHAHWNVRGPSFMAMHDLFGKIAVDVDRHADAIAERTAALGGVADGTVQAVARESMLAPYPALAISQGEHVDAMSLRLAALASRVRRAATACDHDCDPVSAHLLLESAATIEKSLWLVESHRITSS